MLFMVVSPFSKVVTSCAQDTVWSANPTNREFDGVNTTYVSTTQILIYILYNLSYLLHNYLPFLPVSLTRGK